jgi:hypothetical protein
LSSPPAGVQAHDILYKASAGVWIPVFVRPLQLDLYALIAQETADPSAPQIIASR